ncbi:MAG: FAD-dependent oxidoreductase [Elusimicrobia bacterium]|nr:FAD-dependent oxidoreductase [Candidatus Obscuribacterium magneticum]
MKTYDVIVIGAGRIGGLISEELSLKNLAVLLIKLPGESEDRLRHHLTILTGHKTNASPEPSSRPGIDLKEGPCTFLSKTIVRVNNEEIAGKRFVLAMGVKPFVPAIPGVREAGLTKATDILKENRGPGKAILIGGGPTGVLLSQKLLKENRDVTLVTRNAVLLSTWEPDISSWMATSLKSQGAHLITEADITHIKRTGASTMALRYKKEKKEEELSADEILLCTGFLPNTEGFQLENARVYINKEGRIVTEEEMRTSAPHVWAAGSVTGPPFHLALEDHQARLVVHNMTNPFFARLKMDFDPIPMTLPTDPPLASLGVGEKEACKIFKDVKVERLEFDGGLIKIIGRRKSGLLIGAHICSPHAQELILYFDLVLRAGIPLAELVDRHHFPAFSICEMIYEGIKRWAE